MAHGGLDVARDAGVDAELEARHHVGEADTARVSSVQFEAEPRRGLEHRLAGGAVDAAQHMCDVVDMLRTTNRRSGEAEAALEDIAGHRVDPELFVVRHQCRGRLLLACLGQLPRR